MPRRRFLVVIPKMIMICEDVVNHSITLVVYTSRKGNSGQKAAIHHGIKEVGCNQMGLSF